MTTGTVLRCNKHWTDGQTAIYRGTKVRVIRQHGNWVRIEEVKSGGTYSVYADLLDNKGKKPKRTDDGTRNRDDVGAILDGCKTREQYKKAVEKWPEMIEYVDSIDFSATNSGIIRMRIGNKLRATLKRSK